MTSRKMENIPYTAGIKPNKKPPKAATKGNNTMPKVKPNIWVAHQPASPALIPFSKVPNQKISSIPFFGERTNRDSSRKNVVSITNSALNYTLKLIIS